MRAPKSVPRARSTRKAPTQGERWVWERLRGGKLGTKFRRQHPFGPYILDFYSDEAKLVIELDGDSHEGREAYDDRRAAYLRSQGLTVLRFHSEIAAEDGDEEITMISETLRAMGFAVPDPAE